MDGYSSLSSSGNTIPTNSNQREITTPLRGVITNLGDGSSSQSLLFKNILLLLQDFEYQVEQLSSPNALTSPTATKSNILSTKKPYIPSTTQHTPAINIISCTCVVSSNPSLEFLNFNSNFCYSTQQHTKNNSNNNSGNSKKQQYQQQQQYQQHK
ncbi:hypothetical protein ACTFIU_010906 [Dictyostelium citrinum]